jgi:hypothetical protein
LAGQLWPLDLVLLSRNGATLDIDIIVPKHLSESIEHDEQFWEAIQTTNAELAQSGLFVAHILDAVGTVNGER